MVIPEPEPEAPWDPEWAPSMTDQALVQRYMEAGEHRGLGSHQQHPACRRVVLDEYLDGITDGYMREKCEHGEQACDGCDPNWEANESMVGDRTICMAQERTTHGRQDDQGWSNDGDQADPSQRCAKRRREEIGLDGVGSQSSQQDAAMPVEGTGFSHAARRVRDHAWVDRHMPKSQHEGLGIVDDRVGSQSSQQDAAMPVEGVGISDTVSRVRVNAWVDHHMPVQTRQEGLGIVGDRAGSQSSQSRQGLGMINDGDGDAGQSKVQHAAMKQEGSGSGNVEVPHDHPHNQHKQDRLGAVDHQDRGGHSHQRGTRRSEGIGLKDDQDGNHTHHQVSVQHAVQRQEGSGSGNVRVSYGSGHHDISMSAGQTSGDAFRDTGSESSDGASDASGDASSGDDIPHSSSTQPAIPHAMMAQFHQQNQQRSQFHQQFQQQQQAELASEESLAQAMAQWHERFFICHQAGQPDDHELYQCSHEASRTDRVDAAIGGA